MLDKGACEIENQFWKDHNRHIGHIVFFSIVFYVPVVVQN
jgi:hypothetical protein